MAAEGGGALKKYKAWAKYTKVNTKHKGHKACCKNLKKGDNPLVQALEKCGYHDVVFYHSPTGVTQAGSYRPAFVDQLKVEDNEFTVVVKDEAGIVLPADNENCTQGCSDKGTLKTFRDIVQEEEKRKAFVMCPFGGYGWKVATSGLRSGETGGYLIATTVKQDSFLKPGYYKAFDDAQNADYWQKYEGSAAVEGDYSYKPSDVFDVKVGDACTVLTSKADFDALGVSAHTPFTTQEKWDEDAKNVLGQDCVVKGMYDGGDGWEGYNVEVEATHLDESKHTAVVPIQALRKDQGGKTALLLGEVGQFVFKAEIDLFETKGHKERASANMINPLVAEWTNIIGNFGGDELGYGEFLDYEDEDNEGLWNCWHPEIQAWLTQMQNEEKEYGDLGYGMD